VDRVNERERREWLFPNRTETFEDVDLALLDPAEEGDRQWLIKADHPELADSLEAGLEEVEVDGQAMSPTAHLALHEMVAAQLWDNDSPETWYTVERLIDSGFDHHEILHMVASALATEMFRMNKEEAPFDMESYAAALAELPESFFEAADDAGVDPAVVELIDRAEQVLADRGPVELDELVDVMSADSALDGDEVKQILVTAPSLVQLAGQRLGWARALLAGAVLTHRVSEDEATHEALAFSPDLLPLSSLVNEHQLLPLSGGGVADLFDPEDVDDELPEDMGQLLGGPEGWLRGTQPGQLIGFRVGPDDVEVVANVTLPPTPDTLPSQLRSAFDRCGNGSGMPTTVVELVCQLAESAPKLVQDTALPPIGDLLAGSDFEVRDGFTGPSGTNWASFARLETVIEVAAAWELDPEDARGLMMASEVFQMWLADGTDFSEAGDEIAALLQPFDMGEAFVEINSSESPDDLLAFFDAIKAHGGPHRANDLGWVEALAAKQVGRHERAEEALRRVLAADPDHEGALAEVAWYASDRGDASRAIELLERLEDNDERLLGLLRRYAGSTKALAGRNNPCPCGSGKKYKHCHLGTIQTHSLPERVDWLWEKTLWFLRTSEWEHDLLDVLMALSEGAADSELMVDVRLAQSLLLFQGGAIEDFLRQRGWLLPEDERDLAETWAATALSLYEVIGLDQAVVKLRDVRSGETVDVNDGGASTPISPGQLIAAHPLFDGEGYRLLGDVVSVPLEFGDDWVNLLNAEAQPDAIAVMIAASRSAIA
jgi:tetratricopeptide (TPR) repeat protein